MMGERGVEAFEKSPGQHEVVEPCRSAKPTKGPDPGLTAGLPDFSGVLDGANGGVSVTQPPSGRAGGPPAHGQPSSGRISAGDSRFVRCVSRFAGQGNAMCSGGWLVLVLWCGVGGGDPECRRCVSGRRKRFEGRSKRLAPALASRFDVAGPHYRVPGNCSGTTWDRPRQGGAAS